MKKVEVKNEKGNSLIELILLILITILVVFLIYEIWYVDILNIKDGKADNVVNIYTNWNEEVMRKHK